MITLPGGASVMVFIETEPSLSKLSSPAAIRKPNRHRFTITRNMMKQMSSTVPAMIRKLIIVSMAIFKPHG